MFAKSLILLSVISSAFSASVKFDSTEVQELIAKTVEDILGEERIKQHERYAKVLKKVDALKERNDRMEERIKYLEQENTDKDRIICSLQTKMFNMIETVEDNSNDVTRNLSLNRPQEFVNRCQYTKNKSLADKHREVRKKRQVVPTHFTPTPRIAFSAYLTRTNSHLYPGNPIKFDHVLYDDGHGYNPYTGSFTAPVSGTYLFMFQFDARIHTFVRLTVDGKNIVDAVVNPHINTQDRENMSGNSAIIHVGIGQAVIVEVYDAVGEVASSDKYRLSTFSGMLLYPELHN